MKYSKNLISGLFVFCLAVMAYPGLDAGIVGNVGQLQEGLKRLSGELGELVNSLNDVKKALRKRTTPLGSPRVAKGRTRPKVTFQEAEAFCTQGNIQELKVLIAKDSTIVSRLNSKRETLLHKAAEGGKKDIAELLVKKGANINAVIKKSKATPLHYAAMEGHFDVVQLLVDNGADSNIQDEIRGWTALHAACLKGYLDIVRFLLNKNKALLEREDKFGQTPLFHTAVGRHLEVFTYLLLMGADSEKTNTEKKKPIEVAGPFEKDFGKIVVEVKRVPLPFACALGEVKLVNVLLSKSADITAQAGDAKISALHSACDYNDTHK